MHKVDIDLPENIRIDEFKKQISYISESIQKYSIQNRKLSIFYNDLISVEELCEKVLDTINRFIDTELQEESLFDYSAKSKSYICVDKIMKGKAVSQYGNGLIGLSGNAVELFEYFDNVFKAFAKAEGAEEENYPVLLPLQTLYDTGYMKTSPQYGIFCSSIREDMNNLQRVGRDEKPDAYIGMVEASLSPSACFHVYEHYRNCILEKEKCVTLFQNVFRNEGRLNWTEFGRLKDYHVREIVFIGNEIYVEQKRENLLNRTDEFIRKLGLIGEVRNASDAFVVPQMQRFKLLQMQNRVKYEVRLNYSKQEQLSVASFNLHGKTFTHPFHIRVNEQKATVTGCVGYGIERWVLAFLCQFGEDKQNWPESVREGKV